VPLVPLLVFWLLVERARLSMSMSRHLHTIRMSFCTSASSFSCILALCSTSLSWDIVLECYPCIRRQEQRRQQQLVLEWLEQLRHRQPRNRGKVCTF